MISRSRLLSSMAMGLALLWAGVALGDAKLYFYNGPHPIPKKYGGGFDYTEGVHYHAFKPTDSKQYKLVNGVYYFHSDPVLYGYKKKMYRYYGHHPVPSSYGGGWSYIKGPHYTYYKPSAAQMKNYKLKNGYYVYVGPKSKAYRKNYNVYLHKHPRWRYVSHPLYGKKYVPVKRRGYVRRVIRRDSHGRIIRGTRVVKPGHRAVRGNTVRRVTPGRVAPGRTHKRRVVHPRNRRAH